MDRVPVGVMVVLVERVLVAVDVGVGLPVAEWVKVSEAVLVLLRVSVSVGAYRTGHRESEWAFPS